MLNDDNRFGTDWLGSNRGGKAPLSGRVMLVDNRHDMRVATGLRLSSMGLQVTTAETGREALEIAILADNVGYEFHLILMNIDMPAMDGLEATVLFRYAEYDGPIIAVSERSADGIEAISADAGCNGVLLEPVDANGLYNMLSRHLPVVRPVQICAA